MKPFDAVDKKELKEQIGILNEFIEENEIEGVKKVKTVGIKGEKMYELFDEAVRKIGKADMGDRLPEEFIVFYNSLYEEDSDNGGEDATTAQAPPPAATEGKKKGGAIRVPYKSYEELLEHLSNPPTPTSYFDSLLIEGGTIVELRDKFLPYADKVGYRTLRSVNTITGHLKYREERGWKFEREGEGEEQTIKLVGYEHPAPKT